MNFQTIGKKSVVTVMVVGSMIIGAAGGSLLSGTYANAQTTTPAPTTSASSTPSSSTGSNVNTTIPNGTFRSNEDPIHEAKESAQWESQENAGQAPWQHQPIGGSK